VEEDSDGEEGHDHLRCHKVVVEQLVEEEVLALEKFVAVELSLLLACLDWLRTYLCLYVTTRPVEVLGSVNVKDCI